MMVSRIFSGCEKERKGKIVLVLQFEGRTIWWYGVDRSTIVPIFSICWDGCTVAASQCGLPVENLK
jgi:hypothetical protein